MSKHKKKIVAATNVISSEPIKHNEPCSSSTPPFPIFQFPFHVSHRVFHARGHEKNPQSGSQIAPAEAGKVSHISTYATTTPSFLTFVYGEQKYLGIRIQAVINHIYTNKTCALNIYMPQEEGTYRNIYSHISHSVYSFKTRAICSFRF